MLNRDRFLRIMTADPERWASKHDLEQFDAPCQKCGAKLTASVPFATKTARGLIAPPCACGNMVTPYCYVPWPSCELWSEAEVLASRARVSRRARRRLRAVR